MPRYYFDVYNGDGLTRDDEGQTLSSLKDARRIAGAILPAIARDEVAHNDAIDIEVRVRDEAGNIVLVTQMSFRASWDKELPSSAWS